MTGARKTVPQHVEGRESKKKTATAQREFNDIYHRFYVAGAVTARAKSTLGMVRLRCCVLRLHAARGVSGGGVVLLAAPADRIFHSQQHAS